MRRINSFRWLTVCATVAIFCFADSFAGTTNDSARTSSEIRRESNGLWLYVNGVKTPAFAGVVYQNTAGNNHVRSYDNSIHSLYAPLDDESSGGQGHGKKLADIGFQAIRVYELPVEHEDDVIQTKAIFRRLYQKYGIRVLVGDWAGLHTGIDFNNPRDLSRVRAHITGLIQTYSEEPWLLGWQIGNENNYHIRNGRLGHEIDLDAPTYYAFMDGLAGMIKEQLAVRHLRQFVSLGQGDLNDGEAKLIGAMTNIDAVGINCYRSDPNAFDNLIGLAAAQFHTPIYFAEIGLPAENQSAELHQSQYLKNVSSIVFSHSAGALRSGTVIGSFIHEATDETWKRGERGEELDAHYGILGKTTESDLRDYLNQYDDFCKWVLPRDDAPDTLLASAWGSLTGPYPDHYSRSYGHAMAYASRAINIYQDAAWKQQLQLVVSNAPVASAQSSNYWALNTVGTGYFIIGNAWMLQSYDYKGQEGVQGRWQHILDLADVQKKQSIGTAPNGEVYPTNAAGCMYYAQRVFASLRTEYPYAHLIERDGTYRHLGHAMEARFPELSRVYIPLNWQNGAGFTFGCVGLILGFASLSGWRARKELVKTKPIMGRFMRFLFICALIFNVASLFWFVSWWFHPIRIKYYTVQPVLFIILSAIGCLTVFFYFYVWYLLWNMRRPIPMPAVPGHRVAMVTTRVASEPMESLEATFKKMVAVEYPHDCYLCDEENNEEVKQRCAELGVIHFSRKGREEYNQPSGKFQARTKGGNLNSWLYEYGRNYDFVTFLDPDHAPRPDFLLKTIGYFEDPHVAFVQGPQVLCNKSSNWIARGAAEQSYFFYGPIQSGLFGIGACVVNGSHSTFRVSDLFSLEADGYAVHDADDILTSMRIHAKDKIGVYVPEILAEGLAPDTWDEFSKQQRRWASSMFHLLFHYYIPGLFHLPWRCKIAYLILTAFYFLGVAFIGLLIMPFVSVITGNPPVNANIAAFCIRFLPFLALHYGILLFLGQTYLIPGDGKRGFWYRAGMLWVAMWWDLMCALGKATRGRRVRDRLVAAKWGGGPKSPWRAVRPHLILTLCACAAFLWAILASGRRETVWGSLPFLGLIALSQGFLVLMVSRTPAAAAKEPEPARQPVLAPAVYSQQPREL